MGMFDYVRCEFPLPDGFEGDLQYQTKDTPSQYLAEHTITADGKLVQHEPWWHNEKYTGDMELDFHGSLEFYFSNVCATGPFGLATDDDTPPFSRSYTALFDHGKLIKVEGGLDPWESDLPHLSRDEWHHASKKWGEEREQARSGKKP